MAPGVRRSTVNEFNLGGGEERFSKGPSLAASRSGILVDLDNIEHVAVSKYQRLKRFKDRVNRQPGR